ncbi:MAG: hypothetical protein WCL32_08800 [Planctomycetota bacterium]|jgi:hypothetical protein
MTSKIAALSLMAALAMGVASAGPVSGPKSTKFEVPASKEEGVPGENDYLVECRGNEKTSVIVQGDHDPVADLELLVYEVLGNNKDQLVARDVGARDILGVIFTPPRTGMYRVVVRNPSRYEARSNPFNRCYLSIK